jgi:hypothetical protein
MNQESNEIDFDIALYINHDVYNYTISNNPWLAEECRAKFIAEKSCMLLFNYSIIKKLKKFYDWADNVGLIEKLDYLVSKTYSDVDWIKAGLKPCGTGSN